jgi:predicted ATPase
MNIYYFGGGVKNNFSEKKAAKETFIALFWDKWDDFGNKTRFPARIVFDGNEVDFTFAIKILIPDELFSGEYFDAKIAGGWDGRLPIQDTRYTSVPSDIDFYNILYSKFGLEETSKILLTLQDASFLINVLDDAYARDMFQTKPFQDSLLRESGSIKAFQDGWKIFDQSIRSTIDNFKLQIPSENNQTWSIDFRFNSDILPYDINIIIGPNGIGKSYCLKSLVEYWLRIGRGDPATLQRTGHQPFDTHPNLERLILISYSPFEEFAVDLENSGLTDVDIYKYFGFRKRGEDENGNEGIKISRNLPAADSVLSIIECMREDIAFGFLRHREKKIATAIQVLSEAVEFDSIAIQIRGEKFAELVFGESTELYQSLQPHICHFRNEAYITISEKLLTSISVHQLMEIVEVRKGVLFLKNNELVELSSGQRLFSYIVINILGSIRNNSMVIIDEPELFLHPNLEITLIQLLKNLLRRYSSKAIIATHSLVAVREVPANCIHVLRKTASGRDVVRPPFETFGGDIQRISSYVFGDRSVSKPFEVWLESKMSEFGTAENFINALGSEVNEEMLLRINFNERRK